MFCGRRIYASRGRRGADRFDFSASLVLIVTVQLVEIDRKSVKSSVTFNWLKSVSRRAVRKILGLLGMA